MEPRVLSLINKVPKEVLDIWKKIIDSGYQAFLVGGAVRDLILGVKPKDWDITTNAKPEEILEIFPEVSFVETKFGTVGVKTHSEEIPVVEVTTFRKEGKYEDLRRPSEVFFINSLEEDLKRRDFTINALALSFDGKVIDLFGGKKDLAKRIIRTVGDPEERFKEDALRLIRAVRFACELNGRIHPQTFKAIQKYAQLIRYIAWERIRDEFTKIIMTPRAMYGIELLRKSGLLIEIIPELLQGYGVMQNKHHKFDVYTHNIKSLDYAARNNYSLEVRLASLFHDIGKPLTKQGEGPDCTFYNHEIVGAKMVKKILERLRYPKRIVEKVSHLVRHHMFYFDLNVVTEAAIRRFVRRVGRENLEELFQLRKADRIGSGVPKAEPYRLRKLRYLIDKVLREPEITLKNLKINGHDLLKLGIPQGPKIGYILKILLNIVIDDPSKNERDHLLQEAEKLKEKPEEELRNLAQLTEERLKEIEEAVDKELKMKYRLK